MAYKVGDDISDWLDQMVDKMNFGCVSFIPENDLNLDSIKVGYFMYVASSPYEYVFPTPMKENTAEIVLYAKGTDASGEVTLLTSGETRTGFTVQAPIDCRVDFIIGYKNDE